MAVKQYRGAKGKCDKLFKEIVLSVGFCENCKRTKEDGVQLQTAHNISRGFDITRCDLRNAFCLCAACHRYFSKVPVEFAKFVWNSWAKEYYADLFTKFESKPFNVVWDKRVDFLQRVIAGDISIDEARHLESSNQF